MIFTQTHSLSVSLFLPFRIGTLLFMKSENNVNATNTGNTVRALENVEQEKEVNEEEKKMDDDEPSTQMHDADDTEILM